jgi:hypothetical protein
MNPRYKPSVVHITLDPAFSPVSLGRFHPGVITGGFVFHQVLHEGLVFLLLLRHGRCRGFGDNVFDDFIGGVPVAGGKDGDYLSELPLSVLVYPYPALGLYQFHLPGIELSGKMRG